MCQKMRFKAFCGKSNHGIGIFDCWNWKNKVSANILRKPHVREKSGSKDIIFAVDPKWPYWMIRRKFSFFLLIITQNGSIRGKKWSKLKFKPSDLHLPNSGHLCPRLSHFFEVLENEVLVDFFDFDWLDMLDNAAYELA